MAFISAPLPFSYVTYSRTLVMKSSGAVGMVIDSGYRMGCMAVSIGPRGLVLVCREL